jgi:hypothetical protein
MPSLKARTRSIKEGYDISVAAADKSSEIMRQLALGGIAIIWIFKVDAGQRQTIPTELFWPGLFLVLALLCDLVQYIVKSEWWRIVTKRNEENNVSDFAVSPWLGRIVDSFYWIKMSAVGAAYVFLVRFLILKLFGN